MNNVEASSAIDIDDIRSILVFSLGGVARTLRILSYIDGIDASIIWVDPLLGRQCSVTLLDLQKVDRIEAVLSLEDHDIEIYEYSLPELYSVTAKTVALSSLMPGLKATGTINVSTVSNKVLAARLANLCESFSVVIDNPGQEHVILEFLENSNLLQKVDKLYLRAGVEPFFEGAHAAVDLAQRLKEQAFSEGAIVDESDPDWPIYKFKSDQRTRLVNDLRAQLSEVAQSQGAFKKAAAELQNKVEARDDALARSAQEISQKNIDLQRLTKERDAVKAAETQSREDWARQAQNAEVLSKEIESLKEEVDKAQKALVEARRGLAQRDETLARKTQAIDERDKKIDQLTQKAGALSKETESLTAELAARDEIASQSAQEADLRAKEVQQLTKERGDAQEKIAQLEEAIKKLRKDTRGQQALSTEKASRLSSEVERLRFDLRRATAVQETLQSEKDILRSSNKATEEENQKLRKLLQQLTPKLREAAEQVRKITPPPQASSILNRKSTKSPKTKASDRNE